MSAAAKTWCDDWACPARVSCAHHFGRSAAYGGVREHHEPIRRRSRMPDADSCPDYRFDRPKPWLAIQPWQSASGGLVG